MVRVGFVGWRGMVGSVLMGRIKEEDDFTGFESSFFSTSQAGQAGPAIAGETQLLEDAQNIEILLKQDIIVTCQGGDYTNKVYPELRKTGWTGYWIDAASTLRMEDDSTIVLDPVNRDVIDHGLSSGIKNYIGSNCTVSLMLMAIDGLFKNNYVEWLTSMTYQAASGAGAKNMRELVAQIVRVGNDSEELLNDPNGAILDLDRKVTQTINHDSFPISNFCAPLACSLIPWIDKQMDNGQSKEEWKGFAETNKILQTQKPVMVDGICVRISTMRCHSQALTIKLNREIPLDEIEGMLDEANQWVSIVPNTVKDSLSDLTPAAVSGTLKIPVGRLRKLNIGPEYLTLFTVGDQLLWGAAEPIRRILRIVLEHLGA